MSPDELVDLVTRLQKEVRLLSRAVDGWPANGADLGERLGELENWLSRLRAGLADLEEAAGLEVAR